MMTGMRKRGALAAAVLLACAGHAPASAQPVDRDALERMLAGESQIQGPELERRIAVAAAHPLGSMENPVRAAMPRGQRAYLQRLRCADGAAPTFGRIGNFGAGVYGNIIDGYRVRCAGGTPAETVVYMDMYHRGHVEERPVPGFTIQPSGPTA